MAIPVRAEGRTYPTQHELHRPKHFQAKKKIKKIVQCSVGSIKEVVVAHVALGDEDFSHPDAFAPFAQLLD